MYWLQTGIRACNTPVVFAIDPSKAHCMRVCACVLHGLWCLQEDSGTRVLMSREEPVVVVQGSRARREKAWEAIQLQMDLMDEVSNAPDEIETSEIADDN